MKVEPGDTANDYMYVGIKINLHNIIIIMIALSNVALADTTCSYATGS